MLIGEILIRKDYIETKISELTSYLEGLMMSDIDSKTKASVYTNTINQLFDMYNKLQSHRALLDKENSDTSIVIGKSEISVLDAVHILKTTRYKIDVLSRLINSNEYNLSISELMDKRDILMEEYITMLVEVSKSDWLKDIE